LGALLVIFIYVSLVASNEQYSVKGNFLFIILLFPSFFLKENYSLREETRNLFPEKRRIV